MLFRSDRMYKNNYIDEKELLQKNIDLVTNKRTSNNFTQADYYFEEIRKNLYNKYGEETLYSKGLVIKTIKTWLKPEPGMYKLLNDEVICYSTDTGKQLRMEKGIEVELVRSHDDKIIIKHEGDYYNLVGDNFVYFNWWWEPLKD